MVLHNTCLITSYLTGGEIRCITLYLSVSPLPSPLWKYCHFLYIYIIYVYIQNKKHLKSNLPNDVMLQYIIYADKCFIYQRSI